MRSGQLQTLMVSWTADLRDHGADSRLQCLVSPSSSSHFFSCVSNSLYASSHSSFLFLFRFLASSSRRTFCWRSALRAARSSAACCLWLEVCRVVAAVAFVGGSCRFGVSVCSLDRGTVGSWPAVEKSCLGVCCSFCVVWFGALLNLTRGERSKTCLSGS